MKIGFDAKRLFNNFTGLGNYSRTLVSELHRNYPQDELLLFTPKITRESRTKPFIDQGYSIHTAQGTPSMLHWRWRGSTMGKLAAAEGCDLFHGLSHEIPTTLKNTKVKSVVTMHDLIFMRYPQYYPGFDRAVYRQKVEYACKNAHAVVAISQRTATDLQELIGVDEERLQVIYQGCDPIFSKAVSDMEVLRLRTEMKLDRPYLISVGTIEDRKDQLTIVKAFMEGGWHKSHDLLLVGKQKRHAKVIHSYLRGKTGGDRIHWLEQVPFKDLPVLLRGARCSIYASKYEGFGLPVLESMSVGTPVIAASGSCLEEVGGDVALYFEPGNTEQLQAHISTLVSNDQLRQEKRSDGLERAKLFSNRSMAKAYHELYEQLTQR